MQLCDRLSIKKTFTPSYNPQSNMVERFHRSLNTLLRILLDREDTNWPRYLGAATLAYNTKVNKTTGMTPFHAMMGREARLPVEIVIEAPTKKHENPEIYADELINRFVKIYAFMRKNQNATIRRNAKLYTRTTKEFHPQDEVWYLCPRMVVGKPSKLTDQWLGPYVIVKRMAEVLYKIRPKEFNGPEITVHVSRLTPCNKKTAKNRMPKRLAIEDEGDELAEEIRPERIFVPIETGIPITTPSDAVPEIVDKNDYMASRLPDDDEVMRKDPTNENLITMPSQESINDEISMDGSKTDTDPNNIEMMPERNKRGRSETEEDYVTPQNIKPRKQRKDDKGKAKNTLREVFRKTKQLLESTTEDEGPKSQPKLGYDASNETTDSSDIDKICAVSEAPIDVPTKKGSTLPRRSTEGSAGYDICAAATVDILPGQTIAVPVNLRLAVPKGYALLLLSRSGLALKGIRIQGGLIDPDFRGEIKAIVSNDSQNPFKIKRKQRITQAILIKALDVNFQTNNELDWDNDDHAGFGSTGLSV